MATPESFFALPDDLVLTVSRDLFRCAWCRTSVERFAAGQADATGWVQQWQPRIIDSRGAEFCSEMCALSHGQACC